MTVLPFSRFDSFTTPIEVRPGDELRTKCYFNSQSRNTTTVWGESTQQEMCFGILYYYPQNAVRREFHLNGCTTAGSLAFCDPQTFGGCDTNSFIQHINTYLLNDIVSNCTYHGRCYTECKAAILEARRTEPCLRHAEFWALTKEHLLQSPEGVRFLGSLASCEAEIVREELQGACPEREQCQCESSTSAGALRGSLLLMAAILLAFLFLK